MILYHVSSVAMTRPVIAAEFSSMLVLMSFTKSGRSVSNTSALGRKDTQRHRAIKIIPKILVIYKCIQDNIGVCVRESTIYLRLLSKEYWERTIPQFTFVHSNFHVKKLVFKIISFNFCFHVIYITIIKVNFQPINFFLMKKKKRANYSNVWCTRWQGGEGLGACSHQGYI